MSVISLLAINPSDLPTIEQIEAEAIRGGDQIEFPEKVELLTHTGYLPVRAYGRDTGFEFYFEKVEDPDLSATTAQYGSHIIATRTFSSFEEGRAALLFLKVAARLTSGAYIYPDDDIVIRPATVANYLEEQIKEYTALIAEDSA